VTPARNAEILYDFSARMKVVLALIVISVQGSACAFAQTDERPPPNPRPFSSLFRSIGVDITRLATREPAIVLAVGGGLALLASNADDRSLRAMAGAPRLEEALDGGSYAGDGRTQVAAAFAVYLLGAATHSPRTTNTGADLIEAQAVSAVLTLGLKATVPRTRPDGAPHSFPSGHSSAAFATADVVEQHFGWKAGVPAYIGAAYIGASRIAEQHHFLSDVVFGSAIGIASARTLAFARHRHEVRVIPRRVPGGAAVAVTLVSLR
jgi:membrane-associated phospholipid phosphatase